MAHFKQLKISKWQQYGDISLEFDRPATILTGANGSGKTTLLSLLSRHSGWNWVSLAVPTKSKRAEAAVIRFFTRIFQRTEIDGDQIGTLSYDNGQVARLVAPKTDAAAYQIDISGQQPVDCIFVPSHRSVYRYLALGQIPTATIDKQNAWARVAGQNQQRYQGGGGQAANYQMKEVLISWSIFGRGNVDMDADPESLRLYEGFQEVLRKLLPATLGFKKFSIRKYEVLLECSSGDFLIDAASGGLSTLIDLAWQIYMYVPPNDSAFTVIIDEVENHLHPTMQRRVLGDLTSAFPLVRFIVSTHSPLIVSSLRDAAVYVLKYREADDVISQRLDMHHQARTATQILDEVLGVSSTMPIWAESEINALVERFGDGPMNEASFRIMREEMQRLGLAGFLPNALGKLLDARGQ